MNLKYNYIWLNVPLVFPSVYSTGLTTASGKFQLLNQTGHLREKDGVQSRDYIFSFLMQLPSLLVDLAMYLSLLTHLPAHLCQLQLLLARPVPMITLYLGVVL